MKNTGIKTGVSMLLLLAFFERLSFKETFDKKKGASKELLRRVLLCL